MDLLALWAAPLVQAILAGSMLLVAVLCIRLDRKLADLRAGRDGVAASAAELAAAVARAEAAVQALKASTGAAQTDLERQIEEARSAGEALKFLTTAARAVEPGARTGAALQAEAPVQPQAAPPVQPARARDPVWPAPANAAPDPARAARQAARWSGLR